MTVQRSSTISHPNSSAQHRQKVNAYTIKPVNATVSRLIHHYQNATSPKRTVLQHQPDTLLHQLVTERDKAKKALMSSSKDLAQQIIQVIKQYNSLVEILVKVETKEGFQVDQALQHYLVFHKGAFKSYGISIRQFLYLEYDPIVLRQKITSEGFSKTHVFLLGSKGIFTELYYLFDKLVSALDHESFSDSSGQHLDIRA